ncbi:aldehyde dehydrogenase (NADP(+)) [Caballeronia sp. RCC_10]|uniref:aldehyde dehydrogenase (NADP(+)) n=1 Tax=Caballeronia sp. RCC_10 TaxID=3239227 RepID=UPI003523A6A9
MDFTGNLFIGGDEVRGTAGTMKALNPASNAHIEPSFSLGGAAEVDRAARCADEAFDTYNTTTLERRSLFLARIADGLEAIKEELAQRTSLETGLPIAQIEAEIIKSATVFRQFGALVRQGRFRQATIDPALPERQPRARMDHRMQKIALGPVAIFGASNFPISYSVAGGDTASALAAGCPVILKAHNAHPGASELESRVITQAVKDMGLHSGVFSMVRGGGNEIGEALVDHPLIKAVTFTGSEAGGMALFRRAQQRSDPIPVFTEMTSVNPTFVLPAALAARAAGIGDGFAERMLVNVGQACLKPAILFAITGAGFDELRNAMIARVQAMHARTMLTAAINVAYRKGVERRAGTGAERIATGGDERGPWEGQAVLFQVEGAQLLDVPSLSEELFGPAALLVRLTDFGQMEEIAKQLRGQLSATMHIEPADYALAARLLPVLERRTGRIVVNAFSHPQEVSYASIHGGPFPATSDSRFTSVGMSAIERFLRPVCYQGFPDELLPEALRAANPAHVPRLIDGEVR